MSCAAGRPSFGQPYNDAVTSPGTDAHPAARAMAPGDRSQERLAALEAKVTALEACWPVRRRG